MVLSVVCRSRKCEEHINIHTTTFITYCVGSSLGVWTAGKWAGLTGHLWCLQVRGGNEKIHIGQAQNLHSVFSFEIKKKTCKGGSWKSRSSVSVWPRVWHSDKVVTKLKIKQRGLSSEKQKWGRLWFLWHDSDWHAARLLLPLARSGPRNTGWLGSFLGIIWEA